MVRREEGVRERDHLLADQVVKRALRPEATLDRPRRRALFNPDLLEPHGKNIPVIVRSGQSSTSNIGPRRPRALKRGMSGCVVEKAALSHAYHGGALRARTRTANCCLSATTMNGG
jgi:hypothetical protein